MTCESFGEFTSRRQSGWKEVERLKGLALGAGEAEAIVVCTDIKADGVLMDDARAREFAAKAGVRALGVLGLLVQAKQAALIGQLSPLMDRLTEDMNFRISADLRRKVLTQAGE